MSNKNSSERIHMCLDRLAIGDRPEINYWEILGMTTNQILNLLYLPLDHEDYRYVTEEECSNCIVANRCPDAIKDTVEVALEPV